MLGSLLRERGLAYDLFAVGGGALLLLGLIARPTKDIDIVGVVESDRVLAAKALPDELRRAIADVGRLLGMQTDWMNAGPAALTELGLPSGALERTTVRDWGGLRLRLASREDQIFFKLYAAVDQGPHSRHFMDLRALRPTRRELLAAAGWARTHDPSEGFRRDLNSALAELGVANADV